MQSNYTEIRKTKGKKFIYFSRKSRKMLTAKQSTFCWKTYKNWIHRIYFSIPSSYTTHSLSLSFSIHHNIPSSPTTHLHHHHLWKTLYPATMSLWLPLFNHTIHIVVEHTMILWYIFSQTDIHNTHTHTS